MKRKTWALIAAVALPASLYGQSSAFTFRDFTVGDSEEQHRDSLRSCSRSPKGPTERYCFFRMPSLGVIAGQPVIFGQAGFESNRLSTLEFQLRTGSFDAVAEAFKTKWGAPCSSSAPIVRNGIGNSFTNDTITWCFGDGKITASRYYDKVSYLRVYFRVSSIAAAEEQAPPLDF